MPDLFQGHNKRIVLQAFEPEQIPLLYAHLNHIDLAGRRYLPWGFSDDLPLFLQQVEMIHKKWSEKKRGFNLAVITAEGGDFVGHVSCDWHWDTHCPQASIVIYPEFQRQGYGSEGLKIIMDYLFQTTPAYNISGWIADWNVPALNFAKKNGFNQCGRSRRVRFKNGFYSDNILVDILRDEWSMNCGEATNGT